MPSPLQGTHQSHPQLWLPDPPERRQLAGCSILAQSPRLQHPRQGCVAMSLRRAWAGVGEAFPSSLSPETWFELVRASDCQSWRCGRLPLPARAAASPSRPWGLGASPEVWGSCRTPWPWARRERKRRRKSWVGKSFVLSWLWDSLPRPWRAWERRRTTAGSRGCMTWWLSLQVGAGSSSPGAGTAACPAPGSCPCAPRGGDSGMGPAGHPAPIP